MTPTTAIPPHRFCFIGAVIHIARCAAFWGVAVVGIGFAPRAAAQFLSPYDLVDGGHPAGVYNGSNINALFGSWSGGNAISNTGILDTSLAPASVFLSESGGSGYNVQITTPALANTTVSFNWTATSTSGGAFGYYSDGNFNPLTGTSGTVTFTTVSGSAPAIGFVVGGTSLQRSSLTISNFSAGPAAIPEPASTALAISALAGLMMVVARRRGGSMALCRT